MRTRTVGPSSTETLDKPSIRLAVGLLAGILLAVGCWDLGLRLVGDGPTLDHCLQQPAPACVGQEYLLGGDAAFHDGQLAVRILSRKVVALEGWPKGLPLPAEGSSISVKGVYLGDGLLRITSAATYPLAGVDVWLACLAVLVWVLVLALYLRARWKQRFNHG